MAPQIFFITGTSTGFGYELVKKALSEGDKVIATARNSSKLKFDGTSKDNFLAVDCDVTDQESIDKAFEKAMSHFGRIDVVVNNAGECTVFAIWIGHQTDPSALRIIGYGLSGEFESLSDRQIRTQMEVNFFGLLNVTRKALEVMREENKPPGGKIQQITSIGGQRGVPLFSIVWNCYCHLGEVALTA